MKINKIMGNLFVKILRLKGIKKFFLTFCSPSLQKKIMFYCKFFSASKNANVSYYEEK